LLQLLAASGAALVFEDLLTVGEVPGSQQIREIGAWLDAKPRAAVVSTISLGLDDPNFEPLIAVASGVLAAPVSSTAGEYLIWFRPERIRTVTWGGDPMKPVLIGEDPSDLSPRRSFAQWHQLVEGTSERWSAGRLHRGASDRRNRHGRRPIVPLGAYVDCPGSTRTREPPGPTAEQPVIVADPKGLILLTNEAFERLLRPGCLHVQ
jgi:two-component system, chemotaxis family, sensor kinase Cph1